MRSWGLTLLAISALLLWEIWQSFTIKEFVMALSDDLNAVKDQLVKAQSEIVAKVGALESALAASGAVPAAVTEAVDALRGVAQGLDDVVPDVVPVDVVPVDVPVDEVPPVE
jgi:hypothetical protein